MINIYHARFCMKKMLISYNAYFWAIVIFVILAIYSWFKSTRGLCLNDELNYFASGFRLYAGDKISDDQTVRLSLYHWLISLFFYIIPNFGVWHDRIINMLLHAFAISTCAFIFIKYYRFSPFFISVISLSCFMYNYFFNIPSLSYNSISSIFLIYSFSLYFLAKKNGYNSWLYSFINALLFYISIIAAPQLLPLLFVLIADIFFSQKFGYSKKIPVLTCLFLVIFLIITVFTLFASGNSVFFTSNIITHSVNFRYMFETIHKIYKIFPYGKLFLWISLFLIIIIRTLVPQNKKLDVIASYFFVLLLIALIKKSSEQFIEDWGIVGHFSFFPIKLTYIVIICSIIYLLSFIKKSISKDYYFFLCITVFSISAIYCYSWTTFALAPGRAYLSGALAIPFLFIFLAGTFYHSIIKYKIIKYICILLSSALLIYTTYLHANFTFFEHNISQCKTPVNLTRLERLYTTPQRAKYLQETAAYLLQRTTPGEHLLTLNTACAINIVTDTTQPIPLVFIESGFTSHDSYFPAAAVWLENALEQLANENRIPTYAVRWNRASRDEVNDENPLPFNKAFPGDVFLNKYYSQIAEFGPYQIFQKNG